MSNHKMKVRYFYVIDLDGKHLVIVNWYLPTEVSVLQATTSAPKLLLEDIDIFQLDLLTLPRVPIRLEYMIVCSPTINNFYHIHMFDFAV